MPLSPERISDIASKLFWDEPVDCVALAAWLAGEGPLPKNLDSNRVYVRLLASIKWYDILDLLTPDQWPDVFSDGNVSKLFPPALRSQYRYVQRVLLK